MAKGWPRRFSTPPSGYCGSLRSRTRKSQPPIAGPITVGLWTFALNQVAASSPSPICPARMPTKRRKNWSGQSRRAAKELFSRRLPGRRNRMGIRTMIRSGQRRRSWMCRLPCIRPSSPSNSCLTAALKNSCQRNRSTSTGILMCWSPKTCSRRLYHSFITACSSASPR